MDRAMTVNPETLVGTSEFRTLMSCFPSGVAVVTAMDGRGHPRGMTCTSVCSVCTAPPTLLVCIRAGSPTLASILESGVFAVNFLHASAQSIAATFSSPLANRFERIRWEHGLSGAPHLVQDSHIVADCAVDRVDEVGDHNVVYGAVRSVTPRGAHAPLVYGLREYRRWADLQH
jgi:flavin reductase (DIM6/NTAB) family NADH-FMN oxidoreductase RutF